MISLPLSAQVCLAVAGGLVVTFVAVDQLMTTVSASTRAGPLTTLITNSFWRMALRLTPRGAYRHRVLSMAGFVTVALVITGWILLLWLGWSLVFLGGHAVLTTTGQPTPMAERIYYAGYVTFTLGNGGFQPDGTFFQLATVAASITGFAAMTLAVTYVIPVVSATVNHRQLASQIEGLGRSPGEIVASLCEPSGVTTSAQVQLVSLAATISQMAQQHDAYPVLRAFHSSRRATSAAPAVAALSEAMAIMRYGLATTVRPSEGLCRTVSSAIANYSRAHQADVRLRDEPPPSPSVAALQSAGLPTAPEDEFAAALRGLGDHRKRLDALVRSTAWDWDAVSVA